MTAEMVIAIAGLWKLVAAIATLVALILFSKPIRERLTKLSRVKTKGAEVEFTDDSKKESKELEAVSPPPKQEDSTNKNITSESHTKSSNNENWFGKMLDAFSDKKPEEAKSAFEIGQANEIDKFQRLKNEVFYNYLQYRYLNHRDAIAELEKLSETDAIRADALYWLFECYKLSRSYNKAKEAIQKSIEETKTDDQKAFRIQLLAELLIEMETPINEVIKLLSDALTEIKMEEFQYPLYLAFASAFKKAKDELMRSVALEKALELRPENTRSYLKNGKLALKPKLGASKWTLQTNNGQW